MLGPQGAPLLMRPQNLNEAKPQEACGYSWSIVSAKVPLQRPKTPSHACHNTLQGPQKLHPLGFAMERLEGDSVVRSPKKVYKEAATIRAHLRWLSYGTCC